MIPLFNSCLLTCQNSYCSLFTFDESKINKFNTYLGNFQIALADDFKTVVRQVIARGL